MIEGGRVFVNGKLITSNGYQPNEGDLISVRKMGKFRFEESEINQENTEYTSGYRNIFRDGETQWLCKKKIRNFVYLKAILLAFLDRNSNFIDQITKYFAVAYLKNNHAKVLIDGVFELQYLENRGMAFGILQNKQFLFVVGALVICGAILLIYGRIPYTKSICLFVSVRSF